MTDVIAQFATAYYVRRGFGAMVRVSVKMGTYSASQALGGLGVLKETRGQA